MTVVDHRTGEIVEPGTGLATVDKTNAAAVTGYLQQARDWLATCVELTGPTEIAVAKAEIATAAEATRQLGLSKEIQLDAQEMVRRAEYALGKAIRKGQAEGTIARQGDIGGTGVPGVRGGLSGRSRGDHLGRPHEVAGEHKAALSEIYQMSDHAEPGQFDAALDEAKAEGNLSRANVVRKIKQKAGPVTRDQRADQIADLAAQGYSSRQMPSKVGVTEEAVRRIARDYGIEIPADKAIGRTRRHNSHRIASETVAALEGLAMGVGLINYDELDPQEASHWADSLNHSLRALNRFHKQIKETTHD